VGAAGAQAAAAAFACHCCQLSALLDIWGWEKLQQRPAGAPMADKTLDLKGLTCPLPILKTRKALSGLPRGATLEVFATDPGSVPDFSAFCETTGNRMVEQDEANGVYRFVIEHRA
jgi:tRNA 2-thiouridine synthesizing protein A